MKAVIIDSPNQVAFKEIQAPELETGKAIVKIKSMGICGSDIGAFRGTNVLVTYPRVIGHELAGEIVEVGENTLGLKIGDRVIVEPYLSCAHCYPCSIDRTNCCEDAKCIGVHVDGGMAELYSHPIHLLHKMPDAMTFEQAAMVEPLAIALQGLHRGAVKEGEHVAIIGAGAIGMLSALAAKAAGAEPILLDVVDERLDFAKNLGVVHTVNVATQDAVEKISEITNGRMAELVIEASGANQAVRATIDYVSNAGRIILTGWPKTEVPLPTFAITKKEIDIRGSRLSKRFPQSIELVSTGKVDALGVVSKKIKMEEIPEHVIELSEHPERYLKIIALS